LRLGLQAMFGTAFKHRFETALGLAQPSQQQIALARIQHGSGIAATDRVGHRVDIQRFVIELLQLKDCTQAERIVGVMKVVNAQEPKQRLRLVQAALLVKPVGMRIDGFHRIARDAVHVLERGAFLDALDDTIGQTFDLLFGHGRECLLGVGAIDGLLRMIHLIHLPFWMHTLRVAPQCIFKKMVLRKAARHFRRMDTFKKLCVARVAILLSQFLQKHTIVMTISSLASAPPVASLPPHPGQTSSEKLVEQDLMQTAELTAAWHQAVAMADAQAPALASNLMRLIDETPEALPLHLNNLTAERQRNLTAAATLLSGARGNGGSELLSQFEQVLKGQNDGVVADNQRLLAKYSQYIVALSELMTAINATVTSESDGKSNLNGEGIIRLLATFCNKWRTGDAGVLGRFSSREEAQNVADKRFRGKTVEVFDTGAGPDRYVLRFSFARLAPIISAVAGTSDAAKNLIEALERGEAPNLDNLNSGLRGQIRGKGVNAHAVQSLTLATGDVQKTHQTDLDLLLNEFSRSISQFDNLVKLYSSLATALTETLKSFL